MCFLKLHNNSEQTVGDIYIYIAFYHLEWFKTTVNIVLKILNIH